MKKLLTIGCVAMAMGAFAAADDVLISFSTPGQDTYADGTKVLDGERYALVFQPTGTTGAFAVNNDGTTVNGSVVLVAPLAKNGKCPPVVFEIDSADYKANYEGKGKFAVYMLDTRVTATSLYLPGVSGMTDFVNGYAAATEMKAASGQGNTLAANKVNGAAVGVALEIDSPTITAMKMENGKVTITVNGMSPAATYKVVSGTDIKSLSTEVDAQQNGDTFTISPTDGSKFFKVKGTKNF